MDPFEKAGVWWLPNQPDNKKGGMLSFAPDSGLVLRLMGSLHDVDIEQIDGPITEEPLLLGVIDNNEPITLYNCYQSQAHHGGVSSVYKAKLACMGVHFTDPATLVFTAMDVSYSFLADWAARSHLTVSEDRHTVRYTPPEVLSVDLLESTVTIQPLFTLYPQYLQVTMQQSLCLRVITHQPYSVQEWLERYIAPLQDLMSFATACPNAITSVRMRMPGENAWKEIPLVFKSLYHHEHTPQRLTSTDMLFTLHDMAEPQRMIQQWFTLYTELRTVTNLFFSVQYGPSRYLESRFLTLTQALEIYHRARFPNRILPKAEHRARVNTIVAAAPAEDQQWIRDQLAYGNEPRLRARIQTLADSTWDMLGPLVRDRDAFAQKVTNTRNYYTHYNTRLADQAAHTYELHWLTEALFFMLQRCFLAELGVTSEQCVLLFQRYHRYTNAVHLATFSWLTQPQADEP